MNLLDKVINCQSFPVSRERVSRDPRNSPAVSSISPLFFGRLPIQSTPDTSSRALFGAKVPACSHIHARSRRPFPTGRGWSGSGSWSWPIALCCGSGWRSTSSGNGAGRPCFPRWPSLGHFHTPQLLPRPWTFGDGVGFFKQSHINHDTIA